MAVKIRLARFGSKKRPYYRIVVSDARSPRDGRFIEKVGSYDPLQDPPAIRIDEERFSYWIKRGAQPTDTVKGLLKKAGVHFGQ